MFSINPSMTHQIMRIPFPCIKNQTLITIVLIYSLIHPIVILSVTVDYSKQLVFYYLCSDISEPRQDVETLQLMSMVMSRYRDHRGYSKHDQIDTLPRENPHELTVNVGNKFISQIHDPSPIYRDPITEWLEESYLESTFSKNKFSSFFMLSTIESWNGCFDMRVYHNVYEHYVASAECLVQAFLSYFSACVLCLSILEHVVIYLSCRMFLLIIFLVANPLIGLGQEMLCWFHCKFYFM